MQNKNVKKDQSSDKKNPMCDSKDAAKYKVYSFLYDMIQKRDEAIKQFKLTHNITNKKTFPKYEIPWISEYLQKAESMCGSQLKPKFMIHPQVSYFQAPLLEFSSYVIDSFMHPNFERNSPVNLFVRMRPLLNQHFLPINKTEQQEGATSKQNQYKLKIDKNYKTMSQADLDTVLCTYQDAFDEYKEPIWRIDNNTK